MSGDWKVVHENELRRHGVVWAASFVRQTTDSKGESALLTHARGCCPIGGTEEERTIALTAFICAIGLWIDKSASGGTMSADEVLSLAPLMYIE